MSDIEKALAEGLRAIGACDSFYEGEEDSAAQRILATPSMQEVARLAAVGAAVEGLLPEGQGAYLWRGGATYTVEIQGSSGTGPTLPAAIAAATGEDEATDG